MCIRDSINAVRELESVEGVSVAESYDGETVTGKGNFNLMVTAEGPDHSLAGPQSARRRPRRS